MLLGFDKKKQLLDIEINDIKPVDLLRVMILSMGEDFTMYLEAAALDILYKDENSKDKDKKLPEKLKTELLEIIAVISENTYKLGASNERYGIPHDDKE